MTAMMAIHVIFVTDFISADFEIRKSTVTLIENEIEDTPSTDIIIDFSNVKAITPQFVHQYMMSKRRIKKDIHEVNLPLQIESVMNRARKSIKK